MSMQPDIGVGAVIIDGSGRLAMVQRGNEPSRGRWALPGGHLKSGEGFANGVRREVAEETQLLVEVGPLVYVFELVHKSGRLLILDFGCSVAAGSGSMRAASDADRVGWFTRDEVQHLDLAEGMKDFFEDSRVREYLQWQ